MAGHTHLPPHHPKHPLTEPVRQHPHRKEEVILAHAHQGATGLIPTHAADDDVYMRMVAKVPVRGVQHLQHPRRSPEEPWVRRRLVEQSANLAHQVSVQQTLVRQEQRVQRTRHREHEVEVRPLDHLRLARRHPLRSPSLTAAGAVPTLAAVTVASPVPTRLTQNLEVPELPRATGHNPPQLTPHEPVGNPDGLQLVHHRTKHGPEPEPPT